MTYVEALKIAKPALFNTGEVKAIRDRIKTVTRQIIKPQPENVLKVLEMGYRGFSKISRFLCSSYDGSRDWIETVKIPYDIGDILYVKETWCKLTDWEDQYPDNDKDMMTTYYRADYPEDMWEMAKWHPAIHMPKEATRIFLRVTDIRVERLQDITEDQAISEGVRIGIGGQPYFSCCDAFTALWNSNVKKSDLYKYSWDANPWVWVIEFEKLKVEN